MFLKQSTSAVVLVGPVLDASGVAVTTAVIGDFTLTKNGTSAALSGNTISHSHNGHYAITLTTGNTDTIGRLTISTNNASYAMPVFRWDICQPTVYDALFSNAVNTSGGLPAATGSISALAGAISTLTAGGVRTELTTELNRIDATVSSRSTLTAGGVRTELATELGRIDVTVSSRLATSGYTAPDNATIGTINTNLGTVNTNVLSRLAASSYVTPLNGGETAAAVWDALLASYTTAGSFGARIVRSTNSNNQVFLTGGNTPHIAADVHAFQTDAITADALASSAVTKIQGGLATLANQTTIIQYIDTEIAAIKTVTDRLNTGLVQDGAVWQFTVNMLENGPAGAGGGSATLGNQILILDQLDLIQGKTDLISGAGAIGPLLAGAVLEPGTITGFPSSLTIGDSYTTANGRAIQLPIVDTDGNPISSTGSLLFADASVTFTISRARETDPNKIITGTATVVDPAGTGTSGAPYALVQLSSSETSKGKLGYKYNAVLKFTWPGTGTDVMSFESSTEVQFDN
jgi:hypothetical protein